MTNQENRINDAEVALKSLNQGLKAMDRALTRTSLSFDARRELTNLHASIRSDAQTVERQLRLLKRMNARGTVIPVLDLTCR